ncbi:MAG: XTP/dITP diphosphatase [Pseudomonadota bacterium]
MSKQVVVASSNAGKIKEMQALLETLPFELILQSEFNVPEADETGVTFAENAIIKASNACAHTGLSAIADDSGIEVDALQGEPGVYSARYAGEHCDDQDNNKKLLKEMHGVEKDKRTARFRCVVVYLDPEKDAKPLICESKWEGYILESERGYNGFGYDPLFYVPSHACSSAELPPELKNKISHRGQALQELTQALRSMF